MRDANQFEDFLRQALQEVDTLMGQDAAFRCMFTLLRVTPIFVTTDQLFGDPHLTVKRIADAAGLVANEADLARSIELGAAYGRSYEDSVSDLTEHFKRVVFRGA